VNCTATPNDPNDPDGGPNKLQNFPELAAATRGAGMLRVAYKVPSLPANSTYPLRVEFFKADSDGQEGQSFLGFDTFTAADFAAGLKTVTIATVALIAKGDKLVATATDSLPAGGGPANTSEFSLGLLIGTNPWHNAVKPLDVNGGTNNAPDDHIAAGDALAIINYINSFGPTDVPEDAAIGLPFGFLDPTNDNNVAPADALEVINHINAFGNSEGESSISDSLVPQVGRRSPDPDLLTLLALDTATGTPRRRR
jgi:hypothetical protein